MYCKEIIGIHIGENGLEYSGLMRELRGWTRATLPVFGHISGRTGLDKLEGLLANLKPKKTRRLCISIPRSRYFLRELSFPGLTAQEAENSARIAVNMHSHLPSEEIYFDVCPLERNGATSILLAYARRTYIDPILDIIKRTGHHKSLYCISPSGLGSDLFLRSSNQVNFPTLSIQQEERELVLNLHGKKEWQGSHILREEGGSLDLQKALRLLPAGLGEAEKIFQIGTMERKPAGIEPLDPCSVLKGIDEFCSEGGISKGQAACFIGTSSYPQISFQEGPRKRPLFLRINTFQWSTAIVAIVISLLTGFNVLRLERITSTTSKNQEVVARLEKQYLPLKKINDKIEKIKKLEQDMNDFLHERPPVLVILKELAIRTPLNSWIRSCTIRGSVVRVSAEGGSAVETMEEWRKSPLFSEVKLVSPVTKNRQQQERYTVEIRLASRGIQKSRKEGHRQRRP